MHLKKADQSLLIFYSKPFRHLHNSKGGLGAMLQGTQKIMKQGSPILTGSALDLTISGKGFFILSPREDADRGLPEMDHLV